MLASLSLKRVLQLKFESLKFLGISCAFSWALRFLRFLKALYHCIVIPPRSIKFVSFRASGPKASSRSLNAFLVSHHGPGSIGKSSIEPQSRRDSPYWEVRTNFGFIIDVTSFCGSITSDAPLKAFSARKTGGPNASSHQVTTPKILS